MSGELPHLPEAIKAQHRRSTLSASYKLCIDKTGHVDKVTPVGSIPGADEQVMATLRG